MILPFRFLFTATNQPKNPLSIVDNLTLAGYSGSLVALNLNLPTNPFQIKGLEVSADTACLPAFGVYAATQATFFELWSSYSPMVQYALARSHWDEQIYVPAPGGTVTPAFELLAGTVGSGINVRGILEIVNIARNPPGAFLEADGQFLFSGVTRP